MQISKQLYGDIISTLSGASCESGGILGEKGGVVSCVAYDNGVHKAKCSYEPNVDLLNKTIELWQRRGIVFAGVFHTHFFAVETLSDGDIAYIRAIMQAMPREIEHLYFPIVLPGVNKIIPYLAARDGDSIDIRSEEIQIME